MAVQQQSTTPPTLFWPSNLTRFQPRVAQKASGTPLVRYVNGVTKALDYNPTRRRLPITGYPPYPGYTPPA